METSTDAVLEARRVPDAPEIRSLLEKYFDGPIEDRHVSTIEARIRELLADGKKRVAEDNTFLGNARIYSGRAWREDMPRDVRAPRVIDYVGWLGSTMQGFPAPKPYCPPAFVGSWKDAAGHRWQLSADGTFETDAEYAAYKQWFVVGQAASGHVGDSVHLKKGKHDDAKVLVVERMTDSELVLARWGGAKPTSYALQRTR